METSEKVEVWPGIWFTSKECYIRGLEVENPANDWDVYNKSVLWQNVGNILYDSWENGDGPTSCVIKGRSVGVVDCFCESLRLDEDPEPLLLLAAAMRGLNSTDALRNPRMPLVERVEVIPGKSWTALQCISRGLKSKSPAASRAWRCAGEIQYVDKDVSTEQLVVNGQSYDMMQCFVKAWLEDPGTAEEKFINLLSDMRLCFFDHPLHSPVVVDGTPYVLVVDDYGQPVCWSPQT